MSAICWKDEGSGRAAGAVRSRNSAHRQRVLAVTGPEGGESSGSQSGVLGPDGTFTSSWLRERTVAPMPVRARLDAALARRIEAGCRAVGAPHLLATSLADVPGVPSRVPADADLTGLRPPVQLRTPDAQGAVLFPEEGYALIAGTTAFMASAVSEGTDTARARFGRYARALLERHPSLAPVAASHPPGDRAWSRLGDVDPVSATAQQLALLEAFTEAGTCGAPEFAHGWWEAGGPPRRTGSGSEARSVISWTKCS